MHRMAILTIRKHKLALKRYLKPTKKEEAEQTTRAVTYFCSMACHSPSLSPIGNRLMVLWILALHSLM